LIYTPESVVSAITPVTEKGGELAMTTAEKLRQEGIQEGRREGSYKTLFSMVRIMKNNGISEEKIARYTNLDINTVKKILNGEPVEISLNWIDER
jgi:predicted transposase YdaD